MVVRGGSVAVKKRGVKGEQTELAWIPPPAAHRIGAHQCIVRRALGRG
jgi:hypothetical protein